MLNNTLNVSIHQETVTSQSEDSEIASPTKLLPNEDEAVNIMGIDIKNIHVHYITIFPS